MNHVLASRAPFLVPDPANISKRCQAFRADITNLVLVLFAARSTRIAIPESVISFREVVLMIPQTVNDAMAVPACREINFLMVVQTVWILTFCYSLEIDRVIICSTILEIECHRRMTASAEQMMQDILILVEPSSDSEE